MCSGDYLAVAAMQRRHVELKVRSEQAEHYRRHMDNRVARLEQESTVGAHQRRIHEELLLLPCPRVGHRSSTSTQGTYWYHCNGHLAGRRGYRRRADAWLQVLCCAVQALPMSLLCVVSAGLPQRCKRPHMQHRPFVRRLQYCGKARATTAERWRLVLQAYLAGLPEHTHSEVRRLVHSDAANLHLC